MASLSVHQVNYSHGQESEQIPVQIVSGELLFAARRRAVDRAAGSAPKRRRRPTPVAVVSHGFWERSLGCDPSIVGQDADAQPARRSRSSASRRRTSPACCSAAARRSGCRCRCTTSCSRTSTGTRRGAACSCSAFARLKPGVTAEQARANLKTVFANLEQAFPVDNKGRSAGARAAARGAPESQRPGGERPVVQQSTS